MKPIFILGTDTGVGKTFLASLLFARYEEQCPEQTLYIKPFQTGVKGTTLLSDAETVRHYLNHSPNLAVKNKESGEAPNHKRIKSSRMRTLCSYSLAAAPHLAAAYDKESLTQDAIEALIARLCGEIADFYKEVGMNARIIIEGSGGVLVPLTEHAIKEPKQTTRHDGEPETLINRSSEGDDPIMLADFVNKLRMARAGALNVILVGRTGLGTLNHTLLSVEALKHRNIPLKGILLNDHFAYHESEEDEVHPNNGKNPSHKHVLARHNTHINRTDTSKDTRTTIGDNHDGTTHDGTTIAREDAMSTRESTHEAILLDNQEFLARTTGLPVYRFNDSLPAHVVSFLCS